MIPSECGCSRITAEAAKLDLGWLLNAAFQVKSHLDNCQPRHWLAACLRLERARHRLQRRLRWESRSCRRADI